MTGPQQDPVLVKRAQIARLVSLGKKSGYGLYLVAIVAFAVMIIGNPTDLLATIVTVALIVGSIILIPAIIFGYAVKAAEREDRQRAQRGQAKRPDQPDR